MLKLYNSLSRKKEVFKPRKRGKVNAFVCGPTTYDLSHIGHARTYIVFDTIVKYLREKEYDVFYLQNITDVDDKIIDRAIKEKIFWRDLSRKFEREYLKDMKALNINSVSKYAGATAHIKEIISQVKGLLEKGYAYQAKDGIYYDIKKFKGYGKLSRRTVLQAEDAVSRIDETKEKRNKGDFCLWKFVKPQWQKSGPPKFFEEKFGRAGKKFLRIPFWPASFGNGRPGWHIEDTAITEKYFGPQYDIHGGARDLIFPHHEAEIAQMEAISEKKPLVKYWLHTGFLTVKGQKMAKSLKNFVTIKDFLKTNSARILRYFVLKTHYRSPIDYTEKEIKQVKKQLERIDEFLDKLNQIKSPNKKPKQYYRPVYSTKIELLKIRRGFEKAMEDDFNTPKAMAVIFSLINKGNTLIAQNKLTPADARDILKFLKEIDKVFSFISWQKPREKVPEKILKLVKERERCRQQKNWLKADRIRKKIKELGYQIKDTKKGPKIKIAKI